MKNSKEFTAEEIVLLEKHAVRAALLKGSLDDGGKTLGAIILEERKFDAEQAVKDEQEKAREAEEQKLKVAAKLADDERKLKMKQSILVAVYDKSFLPHDTSDIEGKDYVTLKVVYENRSKKDITAFKGMVEFRDLFGDLIESNTLKDDDGIKAGARESAFMQIEFNRFNERDVKLAETKVEKLKTVWKPQIILFKDGTSLKTDE